MTPIEPFPLICLVFAAFCLGGLFDSFLAPRGLSREVHGICHEFVLQRFRDVEKLIDRRFEALTAHLGLDDSDTATPEEFLSPVLHRLDDIEDRIGNSEHRLGKFLIAIAEAIRDRTGSVVVISPIIRPIVEVVVENHIILVNEPDESDVKLADLDAAGGPNWGGPHKHRPEESIVEGYLRTVFCSLCHEPITETGTADDRGRPCHVSCFHADARADTSLVTLGEVS